MSNTEGGHYRGELLRNQLWQSANFVSKALFLVALTPLMIDRWGAEQFGLFALASSLLVSMALLDGGVRNLTRLRLVEAEQSGDEARYRRAFAEGVLTFGAVVVAATVVFAAFSASGWLEAWFRLPANGPLVLAVTVPLTGLMMLTLFGLEPLAARGRLSSVKEANTWGALAAMPVVGAAVALRADVLTVVILYSACLIVPNLIYAWRGGVFALRPWAHVRSFGHRELAGTLRAGFWYYLTTVSLVAKTHALTFVVAAFAGPAEAGLFYILLRLTEIVGTVGATASETTLASLAAAPTPAERAVRFRQCWLYVAIFCLHASIALTFLGESMLRYWLPMDHQIVAGLGLAMALFGLAGAVSRTAVNASMGLGLVRGAAQANAVEAGVDIALACAGCVAFGLTGVLVGGSIGVLAMLPALLRIARECGQTMVAACIQPLGRLVPGLLVAAVAQGLAAAYGGLPAWLASLAVAGVVALAQLRAVHRAADAA